MKNALIPAVTVLASTRASARRRGDHRDDLRVAGRRAPDRLRDLREGLPIVQAGLRRRRRYTASTCLVTKETQRVHQAHHAGGSATRPTSNHLLVESVATPQGPRHRVICSLGALAPAPERRVARPRPEALRPRSPARRPSCPMPPSRRWRRGRARRAAARALPRPGADGSTVDTDRVDGRRRAGSRARCTSAIRCGAARAGRDPGRAGLSRRGRGG